MRGIIKKMRLISHCTTLTIHDSPFDCGSAEGRDVSGGGERNRRLTDTIKRDVDEQLIIWSLVG